MGHLIRTPGGALTPADDRMNVGCIVPPPAYFFFYFAEISRFPPPSDVDWLAALVFDAARCT